MALTRSKPAGWAVGEKLTSAQQTAVDAQIEGALQKGAGTDTLACVISQAGSGRISPTVKTAADADTTYALSDGITIIRVPATLTANRAYTLDTTGANDGDVVTAYLEGGSYTATIKTGATTLFVLGSEGKVASFIYKASATAWKRLFGRGPALAVIDFPSAGGTWVAPQGVTGAIAIGCGAGGGGGGGSAGDTSTGRNYCGGGGGGGATLGVVPFVAVPGTTYVVTCGTGGAGGAAGANGADGGASIITDGVTIQARFNGAQGGKGSWAVYNTANIYQRALGGVSSVDGVATPFYWGAGTTHLKYDTANATWATSTVVFQQRPGDGGLSGLAAPYPLAWQATIGPVPASGGAPGTDSGTSLGGQGGGGGGTGPFGVGGAGGAGGNGNNAGAGTAGAGNNAGAAFAGAGGGGGGGGGCGTGGGGAGGAGGIGSVGRVFIVYVVQGD